MSTPPSEESKKSILEAAVHHVTGDESLKPREPQAKLSGWIAEAMASESDKHMASRAPTGTGKGLAYLAPAMKRAAVHGQRTLISTEGLGLQRQLIEKDAPGVAAAAKEVYGTDVSTRVLKGFGNYVCGVKTRTSARKLAGLEEAASDEQIIAALAEMHSGRKRSDNVRIGGVATTIGTALDLLSWAMESEGTETPSDRDTCPIEFSGAEWSLVSIPAIDCKGEKCPLFEYCSPQAARREAAEASIVVTNHTMLAIQATKKIPVVIDNPSLGRFEHIVVDEAHALPGIVRSHGAVEVSGPRVDRAMKRVESAGPGGEAPKHIERATERVRQASSFCMNETESIIGKARDGEEVRLGEADELTIFDGLADAVGTLREMVVKESSIEQSERDELGNSLENLAADIRSVVSETKNIARWAVRDPLADGGTITKICASPVDVSSSLYFNVWTAEGDAVSQSKERIKELNDQMNAVGDDPVAREFYRYEIDKAQNETAEAPRRELSVAAVSATLSPNFTREAGLRTSIRDVPTPFAEAYGSSALYIPLPGPEDLDEITNSDWGKLKLDTKLHPDWCIEHIAELLFANGGSGMVISATAWAGKKYAEALRADETLRFNVYTQWDAIGRQQAIDAWKADETSVIVGTKSIMTGVDAPGETNSLVIIDRPARSPMNPVDKARVDALIDEGKNRFEADARVYVEDAAVLLEQAAGRLIRSGSDRGLVAVLDPRLDVDSAIKYPALTRKAYMRPLEPYGERFDNLDDALDWIEERKGPVVTESLDDRLPDTVPA